MGLKSTPIITVTLVALTSVAVTWGMKSAQDQFSLSQANQPNTDTVANEEPASPLALSKNSTTPSGQRNKLSNKLPDGFDNHIVKLESLHTPNRAAETNSRAVNNTQALEYGSSQYKFDELDAEQNAINGTTADNVNTQHIDSLYNLTPSTDPTIVNSTLLENLLSDWASYNPAGAWEWISNNDSTGTLNKYRISVMQEWLTLNSDEAFQAINSLPTSSIRTRLIADYAAMAASYNPHQAFDWAASLTNPLERKTALDSVVYEWATNDPTEVVAQLDTAVAPDIKDQLLYSAGPTIASQLSQLNSREAMQWTDTLNEEQQALLKPIAFQQWINKDTQEAINWLTNENKLANSSLYLSTSAATLPYRDLDSALTVFPHLQENIQQEMAAPIAYSLYKLDEAQAQAWMYELSSPNILDKANAGYLMATATEEPVSALNMALQMHNNSQSDILTTIAAEVDQQHPEALENWIANTNLSAEQLNDIRSALERNPTDN